MCLQLVGKSMLAVCAASVEEPHMVLPLQASCLVAKRVPAGATGLLQQDVGTL